MERDPSAAWSWWLIAIVSLLSWAQSAGAVVPLWERSEDRTECAGYDALRQPLFGDLHVHTGFSHDARLWMTVVTPEEAYAYARGEAVTLPDPTGAPARTTRIDRPIDFAAVTDHAEFFGATRVCTTPGSPVFDDPLCDDLHEVLDTQTETIEFATWGFPLGLNDPPTSGHSICEIPGVGCDLATASTWQAVQAAAEAAYDRSDACTFTTFVGYEHTASPGGTHLHRNVIFRNDHVPSVATSYLDTGMGGAAHPLWAALEQGCLEAGMGCDALTIPHNSNLSGGRRWPDPVDAADARRRQRREPLVEIFQHKAGSECRFDRLLGLGTDTADELCTFEQDPRDRQGPFGRPGVEDYPRRNLVRNVLKDGVAFADAIGVNPFRLGVIGSTDTHNGTPGNTDERGWIGAQGYSDSTDMLRVADEPFAASRTRFNPGGLAVVWAEENARDAIFTSLARRETYATSGTRPVVRFFGGRLPRRACAKADLVERGYRDGVPMGGEVGPVRGDASPRFVVTALKDPGTTERPGRDLQRIQIVKGWSDADGLVHEEVFDVAGDAENGASVDPATCEPTGEGAEELCAVWEDPSFDSEVHAFYYARVLENPTCRWTTVLCKAAGVDPLSTACAQAAAALGEPWEACCQNETNDAFAEPVVQERAWTSPIWYRPDGVARLRGAVKLGRDGGAEAVKVAIRLGAEPLGFAPTVSPIEISLAGGRLTWSVAVPPEAWRETRRGWRLATDVPGLRSASIRRRGGGLELRARSAALDLPPVPREDAMLEVRVTHGEWQAEHVRLWTARGRRLRPSG